MARLEQAAERADYNQKVIGRHMSAAMSPHEELFAEAPRDDAAVLGINTDIASQVFQVSALSGDVIATLQRTLRSLPSHVGATQDLPKLP